MSRLKSVACYASASALWSGVGGYSFGTDRLIVDRFVAVLVSDMASRRYSYVCAARRKEHGRRAPAPQGPLIGKCFHL